MRDRHPKGRTPLPGASVRGSDSGRPIMALLDLLGRRWQLRVLWELGSGSLTFRALQEACGDVSPTVINRRLSELKEAQLVEVGPDGYRLTELGREAQEAFSPLYEWSKHWAEVVDAAPLHRAKGGRSEGPLRVRS